MSDLSFLFQPHFLKLKPYSSARDEFDGHAPVMLDANENGTDWISKLLDLSGDLLAGVNRYPDPHQTLLKERLSRLKGVAKQKIFIGNGSDEVIDLIIRLFCAPGCEKIVILPPTYGMYAVSAEINNVGIISIPLNADFSIDISALRGLSKREPNVKVLFVCTPNNPTGNAVEIATLREILEVFPGVVVIDEAYIDFSSYPSAVELLDNYPRLIVVQTLSKAWGMAGMRVGVAYANTDIVAALDKIKAPYNVNVLSQRIALAAIDAYLEQNKIVREIIQQREFLREKLQECRMVKHVYLSQGNFLLVKFFNSKEIFNKLVTAGIIVRDRSCEMHCENCLRITVGTKEENEKLLDLLGAL